MGKLIVKETKLQDVKLIHRQYLEITVDSSQKVIQIVISKQLELILILFKIITLFLHKQAFYVACIFNVVKLHKQS